MKIVRTRHATTLAMRFGERIRQNRFDRGWSMRDLAAMSGGLNAGYISRVEGGKIAPGLEKLGMLASAFGLSLADLLKGL